MMANNPRAFFRAVQTPECSTLCILCSKASRNRHEQPGPADAGAHVGAGSAMETLQTLNAAPSIQPRAPSRWRWLRTAHTRLWPPAGFSPRIHLSSNQTCSLALRSPDSPSSPRDFVCNSSLIAALITAAASRARRGPCTSTCLRRLLCWLMMWLLVAPAAAAPSAMPLAPGGQPQAIVFVGPHKAATTHLQAYLAVNLQNVSHVPHNRPQALHAGWAWAYDGTDGGWHPKSHCCIAFDLRHRVASNLTQLCKGMKAGDTEQRLSVWLPRFASENTSVVLASEELDVVGKSSAVPIALRALLAPFATATAVVMYRSPRIAILKSMLRANTFMKWLRGHFDSWMCSELSEPKGNVRMHTSPDANVWAALDALHIAAAYSRSFRTVVIDQGGVAKAGLDITDVAFCELLRLPCRANGTFPATKPHIAGITDNVDAYNGIQWRMHTMARPPGYESRDAA